MRFTIVFAFLAFAFAKDSDVKSSVDKIKEVLGTNAVKPSIADRCSDEQGWASLVSLKDKNPESLNSFYKELFQTVFDPKNWKNYFFTVHNIYVMPRPPLDSPSSPEGEVEDAPPLQSQEPAKKPVPKKPEETGNWDLLKNQASNYFKSLLVIFEESPPQNNPPNSDAQDQNPQNEEPPKPFEIVHADPQLDQMAGLLERYSRRTPQLDQMAGLLERYSRRTGNFATSVDPKELTEDITKIFITLKHIIELAAKKENTVVWFVEDIKEPKVFADKLVQMFDAHLADNKILDKSKETSTGGDPTQSGWSNTEKALLCLFILFLVLIIAGLVFFVVRKKKAPATPVP
jgi:hypothetical protein